MERRYVFTLHNPLKDHSAEHDVAGMVANIELALWKTGRTVWSPFSYRVFTTAVALLISCETGLSDKKFRNIYTSASKTELSRELNEETKAKLPSDSF